MATCRHSAAPLPEGARFCPVCATPVQPEPAARERKLATVLFADLVGSTALGGERTVALVGEAFEFEEPMTIEAKGKPEGVPGRRLARMVAPRRPRGGRGLATTFVGREREMARLEDALAESSGTRRPLLVILVGEPGIGKTSVVREFRDRIPEGTRFRLGRCLSYGRNV